MLILTTSTLALLATVTSSPLKTFPSDLEQQAASALGLTAARVVPLAIDGARGLASSVELMLEGETLDLLLEPTQILSDSFQLLEDRGDGYLVSVPFVAPATYTGFVEGYPDSQVTATWLEDGLWGKMRLTEGEEWWFQPASPALQGASAADHVLYRSSNVLPSGGTCGTDLLPNGGRVAGFDPNLIASPGSSAAAGTSPPFVAELACDADFEYFQDYGSSTGVMNRITSVVNTINTQYTNEVGIQHTITTIVVRTTSNDPYTTTNASNLLTEFQDEWNANQGGIQRDVAQLFTGKNIQGGTIGIAYLSVVCSTASAYSVVESDCCGAFSCTTDLSAHELGHNWSADHCTCSGFTMNPFITCGNKFTPLETVPRIVGYRNYAACLDGGPDPFALFFGNPKFGDSPLPVTFTNSSSGTGTLTYAWDFGDGATSTQQQPTHTYTVPGTYDVSLTVTGSLGSDTMSFTDYIAVDQPFPASCADRFGTGANPAIFSCTTTPIIGATWISTVDAGSIGATGLSILFGYSAAAPIPLPSGFGEILVDPTSSVLVSSLSFVMSGTATHSFAIPNDLSLEALPVFTQVFLNGIGQLTNGIDLLIGK